jgi:hypothetical protein
MLKDGPMPGIKTFATHFLSHGVKLTIVDDGPSRHHSKKATILRDGICLEVLSLKVQKEWRLLARLVKARV